MVMHATGLFIDRRSFNIHAWKFTKCTTPANRYMLNFYSYYSPFHFRVFPAFLIKKTTTDNHPYYVDATQ